MTEHLAAGYRERTPSRRGERNGYYTRDLITPAGRIAQARGLETSGEERGRPAPSPSRR